jgi:hypothetical protein
MAGRDSNTDIAITHEIDDIIAGLRRCVEDDGEHWFLAVMAAIRRWPVPVEIVDERVYRYVIGGEAFDWMLLAERLIAEIADLVPEDAAEELLFHGRFPIHVTTEEFAQLLGAKHKGYLNFQYGVRVEEALQMAVQAEVHKERLSRVWENGHDDDEVFNRLYGATRLLLFEEFRRRFALPSADHINLGELREFTYWLFKHRVKQHDPARVASDTRKGLTQLQRLETRRRAHPPAPQT